MARSAYAAGLCSFPDHADSGLGASGLDYAAAVPGPQQGIVAGASTLVNMFKSLFGGGGGAPVDNARAARAASYLLGVENGSVTSGRYLLGRHPGGKDEKALYVKTVQQAWADRPDIMQAAQNAGELGPDTEDGQAGLAELVRLGVPFNMPNMGGSTLFQDGGRPLSAATQSLIRQLQTMTPGGGSAVSTVTNAITGAVSPTNLKAAMPLLLAAGIGVAILVGSKSAHTREY